MANAEAGTRSFAAPATGYVVNDDGTVLTPKRAVISASSSGVNALISAVTGKKIRVLSLVLDGERGGQRQVSVALRPYRSDRPVLPGGQRRILGRIQPARPL